MLYTINTIISFHYSEPKGGLLYPGGGCVFLPHWDIFLSVTGAYKNKLDSEWCSFMVVMLQVFAGNKGGGRKKCSLPDEASPEGTVLLSHTPSFSSLSRISQLNIPGFSLLYSSIRFSTSGVATCFRFEMVGMWRKKEEKGRKKRKKRQILLIERN